MRLIGLHILFLLVLSHGYGQTIRGEVIDNDDRRPITAVTIMNIYTGASVVTTADGSFVIGSMGGQLIEFKKDGFKTVRVRIPNGIIPPYFRIIMKKGITDLHDLDVAGGYDYKEDSIRYHDLYAHELNFPKMSGIDMVASPFSALSRQNREIWRFQDDYKEFEQQKYVDHVFTPELVAKLTGLTGDSLRYFMRRYRPDYDELRAMNDYTFFNTIKVNAIRYRGASHRVNAH